MVLKYASRGNRGLFLLIPFNSVTLVLVPITLMIKAAFCATFFVFIERKQKLCVAHDERGGKCAILKETKKSVLGVSQVCNCYHWIILARLR